MSLDVINKALKPLQKQMRLLVSRCTLNSAKDDGLLIGQYDALEGETIEDAERLENYGLTAHPPAGSEGVMLSVGGSRDHPVVIASEHREHRPEGIAEGETALYSMFKQIIHLDKDGNIHIKAPKGIFIEAETFEAKIEKSTDFQSETFSADIEQNTNFKSTNFDVEAAQTAEVGGRNVNIGASNSLKLKSDGSGNGVEFEAEVLQITARQKVQVVSDLDVTKNVKDKKGTMQDMRDVYDDHTHPQPGTSKPDREM